MSDKVNNNYLLGLAQAIDKTSLEDADVKTAYWLSRNMRILAPVIKNFETLKAELTSTKVFKQYNQELEAAADDAKAQVQDKYKQVLTDADTELRNFVEQEVDLPEFYKIKISDIVGIRGKDVGNLYDLIESD